MLGPAAGSRPGPGDQRDRESPLDPVGVVLLGVAVFLVLLPLVQGSANGTVSRAKWLLIVAALLAVLAGFVGWSAGSPRHGTYRLVDLGLFTAPVVRPGRPDPGPAVLRRFTTIFFIYTLFLQSGLGYSALLAGLAVTPFALGSAAASAIGGRIVNRYRPPAGRDRPGPWSPWAC